MHHRPTQYWKLFYVSILVLASVSEFWVCLGPPCFAHGTIAIGTFVLTFVCYVVGLRFSLWKIPSICAIAVSFLLTSALLCAYLWLFVHYTYPLPDHCQRDVGGWELTPGAKAILQPGEDVRDLIANNENRVEGVFTAESMRTMRYILTINWLSLMGSLSFLLALITNHAELGDPAANSLLALNEAAKRDLAARLSPLVMVSANDHNTERAHQIVVSQTREVSRDTHSTSSSYTE